MAETRAKLGFKLVKRLGEGPHGVSYLAKPTRQKAHRVVKVLHRLGEDPDVLPEARLEQLRRDLDRIALDHPNLVRFREAGVIEDPDGRGTQEALYLLSDHIDGPDIYRFSARAAWSTILEVIVSALRGLEALHSRGALHGNLHSGNVLVFGQGPRKSARLLDGGLTFDIAETRLQGPANSFAPEVLRGEPVDRRTDLYDLGCLLFSCATRSPLFEAEDEEELAQLHLHAAPRKARQIKRSVPVAVEALIDSLLRKDPHERPASANTVIRELNRRANKRFSTETREVRLAIPLVPRFHGREDAVGQVVTAAVSLAEDRPGGPPAIAVSAEPGQGRTRLLSEARARLDQATQSALRWVQPDAPSTAGLLRAMADLPWHPEDGPDPLLIEAPFLRRVLRDLPESHGRAAPPLAGLAERQRVLESAARFVVSKVGRDPCVVCIDDVQRAEPLLIEVLRLLARDLHQARTAPVEEVDDEEASGLRVAPRNAPLLLLLSLAPEDAYGRPAERGLKGLLAEAGLRQVQLGPLPESDLSAALASSVGRPLQEVRTFVQQIGGAAGSPALALHLLGELAQREAIPPPDGAWSSQDDDVAEALAAPAATKVIARRLEALGDEGPLELARTLALRGRSAPLALVSGALEQTDSETLAQARILERMGFLHPIGKPFGGNLALAGTSLTEAILAGDEAPEARHHALGRAAALLLGEDPRAEWGAIAAHHLLRSTTPRDGVPFALRAAEQVLRTTDAEQTQLLLEPALRALETGSSETSEVVQPEVVRRAAAGDPYVGAHLLSAEALLALSRPGAARSAAQKGFAAARTARDPRGMIRALLLLSRASRTLNDPGQSKGSCEEAVQLAQGGDWKRGLALALHERGLAEEAAGDREEALTSLEEARALFEARGETDDLAEVLRDVARLRARRGDEVGAQDCLDQALDADEEADRGSGVVQTLLLRAQLLRDRGDLDKALETATRARTQARDVLDQVGTAHSLSALAAILRARGQLLDARRHEEAALELWERIGDPAWAGRTRLGLGRIQLERGELEAAEANLTQAAQAFKTLGDRALSAEVTVSLADTYLLRGDLARARDSVDRALEDARHSGDSGIRYQAQCSRAYLSLIQGDLAMAEETATSTAEEAARQAQDATEVRARIVLGLARLRRGRPQEAERELRGAFELAGQRGERALAARARLGIAAVHLIRGEPSGALGEIKKARDLAQDLEDAHLEVESLMALGRLHLFLGQSSRAGTLLEMAAQRVQDVGLALLGPEVLLLRAQALLAQAAIEEDRSETLEQASRLLNEADQGVHTASRRALRAQLDLVRAELLLLQGDATNACERAEAALEASKITGDALQAVSADQLISAARREQGRYEEAHASAERAVSAAEAIRDGEARAAALLKRGRARKKLGQTILAAHDLREAASHIRGIWASLSEDLREDYQKKSLVQEIVRAAAEITTEVESSGLAAPAAAPAPAPAPLPIPAAPLAQAGEASGETLESLRDPLTNLYNHTFFTAQLETEIKRGLRHSRPLALLKVNIDRFKLVRELYGPKTAKKIIREVAALLLRNVRDVDIVARYFGDEFEILLPDTDQHGALLTAKRIGEAVDEHRFEHEDEKIELTLTIGVALFPRDAKDRDALICRVDEALYNARSRGSNSVFSFGGSEESPVETSAELRELDQLMLTREGRTILSMVSRLVNQELNIDRVIELVTGMVVEATRGERGFILLKGQNGEFTFRHGRNLDDKVINSPELKISNSIATDVARSGKPVQISEAIEDDRFRDFKSVMDLGLRSILCAPIKIGNEILGVIYVDHNQVARNFNQEDLNFLIAIADKVAIPIKNSKKLRETEDRLALAEARLKSQAAQLQTKYQYESIIGRSEPMQRVFKLLDRIVETNHSVVIHGESGTGKELIARAIHFNGPRKSKPFVAENCAALSDTLLEAELFGHVKGAFTGADRDSKGLFELANGGTLFLDEIGDMSERMQKKLLRVLQEGEVRPVGGKRVFHVDVRIVSASNKDLKKLVQERKFREDLYYRLNVITVNLPPLRERRDDVVLLVEFFLGKHGEAGAPRSIDRETLRLMVNYDWPGNVRELENEINRLVAMSDTLLTPDLLSPKVREGAQPATKSSDTLANYYGRSLKEVEYEFMREIILHTLEQTNWHRTKAAKILKVPTSTLFNKMKKYGIG